jgi:HSP20 family molecular chaperone IbpA
MPDSPPPEERKRLDAEAKAKEDAEQAALPYKWTQTIKDLDVTIPIPGNIKGRDLDVTLAKTKLKVAIKGQTPFIDVSSQFYHLETATEPFDQTYYSLHSIILTTPRTAG